MNVNNFIAKFSSRGGPASSGRYRVTIIPPSLSGIARNISTSLFNGFEGILNTLMANRYFALFGINPIEEARVLEFFAHKTSLPGLNFVTTERITYGPQIKMPYGVEYDKLTVDFYCTNSMKEKYFFDAWINMIKDPISNDFNYFTEYTTTIVIRHFDQADNFTYGVRLLDAYPVSLKDSGVSFKDKNKVLLFSVDFAYRKWENLRAFDTFANDIGDIVPKPNNIISNVTSTLGDLIR